MLAAEATYPLAYYANFVWLALPVVVTYLFHRSRDNGREWRRAMRQGGVALFYRHLDRAEDAFDEAVAVARRHRVFRDSRVGRSLLAAANVKVRLGGIAEAETCLTEALPLIESTHPPNDFNIALAHGLLADVRFDQGRYHDAERHYRTALCCDEARQDTPGVIYTLQRLGRLLRLAERFTEAEGVYERCVDLETRLTLEPGLQRPSDSAVIHAFSEPDLLLVRGRYDEAAKAYRHTLDQWEESSRRPDNLDSGQMRCDLAYALLKAGDFAGAASAYRDAAVAIRANWGSDHVRFASCLANLSAALAETGEIAEARRRAKESLAIWEENGLLEHPDANLCRRLTTAG